MLQQLEYETDREFTERCFLVEKAGAPVGHVSHRQDGDYKKVGEGAWERVSEQKLSTKGVDVSTKNKYSTYVNQTYSKDLESQLKDPKGKSRLENVCEFYDSGVMQSIREHILTPGKKLTLQNYPRERVVKVLKDLDSYIDKTPLKHDMTLFRGADGKQFTDLKVGQKFTHKTPSSFSSNEKTAMKFQADTTWGHNKVLFKMEARSGQPFAPGLKKEEGKIGFNAKEQEFIHKQGSTWEVTGKEVKQNKDGDPYTILTVRMSK